MRDRNSGSLSEKPRATAVGTSKGTQWLVAKRFVESPVFTIRAAPAPAWPLEPRKGVALNPG